MVKIKSVLFLTSQDFLLSAGSLLICIFLSGSCVKNSYNNRQQEDKLVVLTEIIAGDSANIPIGTTRPAGSGTAVNFQKLNDVQASIRSQDGASENLQLNITPDFISGPLAVYSGGSPFQYQTEYTLSASDPQRGTIEAKTTIPGDFTAHYLQSENDDLNGRPVFRFAFSIEDPADQKNNYIFEAVKQLVTISRYFFWQGQKYNYDETPGYNLFQQVKGNPGVVLLLDTLKTHQFIRLNVFTKDTRTANAAMGSTDSAYRRIFLNDSLFNGMKYETEILVARDHFKMANPQEIGIVQIQVKSVSKELYDYLLQYEKYNLDFGNFAVSNLVSPSGNIQNGFGIFGGSVKKQWSFYYDSLR